MSRDQLETALREALADGHVSRGERRDFAALMAEVAPDRQDLAYLRNLAFKLAHEQLGVGDDARLLSWLENAVKLLIPRTVEAPEAEVHFSPGQACRRRIRAAIDGARSQVDICVFTITDNELSDAIARAHRRGVGVRIITDNDKSWDRGSDVKRLADAGIAVRTDRTENHMHHKFALFDRAIVINGSYNWTRSAFAHNQENIVVTDAPRQARRFADEFERLWEAFA